MLGKTRFSSQAALEAFVTFNLYPFIRFISHSICILSLQDRQQVQKQKTDNIQANTHGLPKPSSSSSSMFFFVFNCFFCFIGKHTGGKQCAFVLFCKFSTHSAFLAPYQQTAVCIPAQGINLVPVDTNSSALYPFPPASWKAFSLLKSLNLCK